MKCEHCKIDFEPSQMIYKGKEQKAFCCEGCYNVWEILHNENLEEFYARLSSNTLEPVSAEHKLNISGFEKFITKDKDGFCNASLMIENIHCQACVWLIEKVSLKLDGVLDISVSATTHKATIIYDENTTSLKNILEKISSLGYKLSAYNPLTSQKATANKRNFYIKLILAIACVMNVMWLSVAKYAGLFSGMDDSIKDIINFAEFIFASAVLFYTGGAFFAGALSALRLRALNMDLLVISGASLVYIYSVVGMFLRLENIYFDSVAMIICFVFIGKYLELSSRKSILDSIDAITDLLDDSVQVKSKDSYIKTPLHSVAIGDIIKLSLDDKVLIDGVMLSGQASFDTSYITGESAPLLASAGTPLISGYKLISGSCEYESTKDFEHSTLNQIIKTLTTTQKSRIEKLANKLSSHFSILILISCVACFLYWISKDSFEHSLINAISVLIIACPCALALATPVCTLVATSVGFANRVLFRHSGVIEDLGKCDMLVCDKTGVLTVPTLRSQSTLDSDDGALLRSLCSLSSHIICAQILSALKPYTLLRLDDFEEIKGYGIKANYQGKSLLGGSYKYMLQNNINAHPSDKTHFYFAIDGVVVAFFEFDSELNHGAKALASYCLARNIHLVILSGDNEQAVAKCAKNLGISRYHHSALPQDKLDIIKQYSTSHNIIMIGDGVNDALALKYAHVGVSLRNASNVAIDSSDIVLLDGRLDGLRRAMILSRKCLGKIKQNLAFSLVYNVFGVGLAFGGYINPLLASALMSLSSLIVTLNALSLKRSKID